MNEEEVVVAPEATEEAVEEVAEEAEESLEDVKAKLAKAQEIAENQRIRAEKAEAKAKETTPDAPNSYSTADIVALAKVHEDDIDRVEKFAKLEGISVREALKNEELKAILAVREEKRKTALASNVSNVRRGPAKVTDDVLVANAQAGKLPENDDDIARLMQAMSKKK